MAMDGTKLDVPDTPANAAAFGRPTGGRGDGAFPQVHKLSLVELGSRAELAFLVKPGRRNEAGHRLGPPPATLSFSGMLVLADREFYSFALWQAFSSRGTHLLWRVRSSITLTPLAVLPDGSYLVRIYPGTAGPPPRPPAV